jgi:hypothetical protein
MGWAKFLSIAVESFGKKTENIVLPNLTEMINVEIFAAAYSHRRLRRAG